ncbi:hypothetical protein AB4Y43_16900 [Paraburkholderia sp. BR10872]|uniref:hypothetical protein n=1 Tax=Paraburkholderia sp. BR10872 TaxID=3236989 RepID=UPI0034D1C8AA
METMASEEDRTVARTEGIPNPRVQLARFRMARLSESVRMISVRGRAFRDAVDDATNGLSRQATTTVLANTFARTYLALRAALDAARAGGVMGADALGALDGIMTVLKVEYAGAVKGLRADVARLDAACDGRQDFTQFCMEAAGRVDRLESFWQTTYKHVPRMKIKL